MTKVVLDSGPIISLSLTNLQWIFEEFYKRGNEFIIPEDVKKEVVDKALQTRRFKLNAIYVMNLITKGIFKVYKSDESTEAIKNNLIDLANHTYFVNKRNIEVIHPGETDVFAIMKTLNINLAAVDEISAKKIFENPESLKDRFEHKFHRKITVDKKNIKILKEYFKDIKLIRSSELVTVAFERGFFKPYEEFDYKEFTNIRNIKSEILEASLWAIKTSGCAITTEEIYKIMNIEKRKGMFK